MNVSKAVDSEGPGTLSKETNDEFSDSIDWGEDANADLSAGRTDAEICSIANPGSCEACD